LKLLLSHILFLFFLFHIFTSVSQNINSDSLAVDISISDTVSPLNSIDTSDFISDSLTVISNDALESVINYSAKDSMPIDFENNLIKLYGEAEVTYKDIKLQAYYIEFDWKNNKVYAQGYLDSNGTLAGSPVFSENDQIYKAKTIAYNFKTKKAKINELFTSEGENYIHGQEVKKDEDNVLFVKDAKYTTCDLEHPHFYIASKKIKILENKIITGPAWLVIEDIPVPPLIPFGFFPKQSKRSSGIVFPAYGESNERGFYLKGLGYYFGLNDYFDLLVQGDIYSRGSWMTSVSSNYSKRYKYNGNIGIQYGHNKFGDPETPEYYIDKDLMITWAHRQDPKARPNSNFSASVNAGSQNSFRNNTTDVNSRLQNTLKSSVSYSKTFSGTPFSMTTSISHSQNLSNHSLDLSAPDMSFNMRRVFPFKSKKAIKTKKWYHDIGLTYNANFRNSLSTTDTMFLRPETWQDWKYGIRHSIPLSTSFKILKYFSFSPSANYTGRTYFQQIEKTYYPVHPQSEGDTIIITEKNGVYHAHEYNFSANLNTRLYGMYNINKFGLIAIRHLLTPSVSFTYTPDFGDARYGYYKNVQTDSSGQNFETYSVFSNAIYGVPGKNKQGNISFNIQNNFEAKYKVKSDSSEPSTEKIKLLDNFNLSGFYNVYADSMKLSNIRFNGRTSFFKNKINIQFSGELDPYAITIDSLRIDKLSLKENRSLGRIKNAYISINASLNSSSKEEENIGVPGLPYANYVDFDVPWNISVNYSLSYSNFAVNYTTGKIADNPTITQTLNFNGNLNLTPKWKINFNSGYDLENNKFTYTSIDLYRDLHCWEMSFSWVPFGYFQSYMFKINVKSSTLKDLKFDKKQLFYDN